MLAVAESSNVPWTVPSRRQSDSKVWVPWTVKKEGAEPTGSTLEGVLDREGFFAAVPDAPAASFDEARAAGAPQPPGR